MARSIEKYGYLEQLIYHLLVRRGPTTVGEMKQYFVTQDEALGKVLARMEKQGFIYLTNANTTWVARPGMVEDPPPPKRQWVDGYLYGFRQGYFEGRKDD